MPHALTQSVCIQLMFQWEDSPSTNNIPFQLWSPIRQPAHLHCQHHQQDMKFLLSITVNLPLSSETLMI